MELTQSRAFSFKFPSNDLGLHGLIDDLLGDGTERLTSIRFGVDPTRSS